MEKNISRLSIDRLFCEKVAAALIQGLGPVEKGIFEKKMRIVIDYDPQKPKIVINYEVDNE